MNKLEKLCIKWLNDNYNHLEPFYMKKYPDYIFHMKNGQCILQYNKKCGYVYVSYKEIWSFFESYFSMSNQQIKDITKIWVEEHCKMGVTTDFFKSTGAVEVVEGRYKVSVTKTTTLDKTQQEYSVEEHYKKSVTINQLDSIIANRIEEQYKDIQTTNNQNDFYFNRDVEELYNQHTNG